MRNDNWNDNWREIARKELQRRRDQQDSIDDERRDRSRKLLGERHPDWDDAALTEIAEEIVGVYRRLDEVCRKRIRQRRPDLDEVGVQVCMMAKAGVGIPMIEPELLQRMHLAPEERMQQVAVTMADKVCS